MVLVSGVGLSSAASVLGGDGTRPVELTDSNEAALCYLYGDPPACDDGV